MKVKIIRGAFLNPFEMQNYYPLRDKFNIEVISSRRPLSDKIDLPLKKLYSPADLPNFPYKYPILNRIFGDAQRLYRLNKAIDGADIVHVAETYYGYVRQAIRAKRRGLVKKVVTTVWETIPFNNQSLSGRRKNKFYAKENIDHFIAVTTKAKTALIKEGVREEKITVIPMGVDLDRFKPRPNKKNKRDINILCVARLVPEKGIMDLINAFWDLKKTCKNLNLTIVGSGPLKKEISGFKNIYIKNVPYNKIHLEYANADIFCLPSQTTKTWEEQFGMCLVEAMASGIPVVSTKTGAIPEVCGEVALLVKPQTPHALYNALHKLIYNNNQRQKMGREGRLLAENRYDPKKIAKQIANVYQKVCP
ncbi:hypothetical protein A2572_01485 [Candidatus Collierbacteria bacterium RIFOXYD1_FULL_40_9]|uniref:Glycosyltransferase subfamily 4-like N-terminal domain-containing protein n=1 Tax=Candidatus Collierbacteria bacterium RIFOXYD1_FULL_40_9 TaxID=1817731 RepID=A0A1F5FVV2_9BACT|nr:MAG: hypothetical protein A2572_01485 [Candidatus Collierbacteria bacterium RIFOXYD1_FULL_40_9]